MVSKMCYVEHSQKHSFSYYKNFQYRFFIFSLGFHEVRRHLFQQMLWKLWTLKYNFLQHQPKSRDISLSDHYMFLSLQNIFDEKNRYSGKTVSRILLNKSRSLQKLNLQACRMLKNKYGEEWRLCSIKLFWSKFNLLISIFKSETSSLDECISYHPIKNNKTCSF